MVVADCIKYKEGYSKVYRRECINGRYCRGNNTKYEKCEPRDEAPLTISSIAKAKGKLTLSDLKLNNTVVTDQELGNILKRKDDVYKKLKSDTEEGLFALYESNNVNVLSVTVTELKSGSLIVDYIVKVDIKNKKVTLKDLNPVKKQTDIFQKDSLFNAATTPEMSELLGIFYYNTIII